MNKLSQCHFGGALIAAVFCGTATADVTINDSVHIIGTPTFDFDHGVVWTTDGDLEIHAIEFSVLSDGQVQLDMFSYQHFDTWFDSMIMVFSDDGNPLSFANLLAFNDDSGFDLNGSATSLDSFIDIFLIAGDYIVTVGAFNYNVFDAELGQGVGGVLGLSVNGMPTSGQYQLDIFGDVAVVPTPGVFALVGLGGLVGTKRKR